MYVLTETTAPAGYNLLSAPIRFTVSNGTTVEFDQESSAVVVYTEASKTALIKNTAGVELPSTGGTGTLVYTMTGVALMLLAGVLLISRKRNYNK